MCGIAGLLGKAANGVEGLDRATALIEPLQHRGPNGVRIEQLPNAALAHARLSIIDLEGGWQPLHAAGSTVIGNGEIYNYIELIAEFGLRDRLATGSDFEPLLHLYAIEGEAAFQRLRGMYAFCLMGCDGRTWLVRDPFGIKPLYVQQRGSTLAFASEPRALLLNSPKRQIGDRPAAQLLSLNYVLDEEAKSLGVQRLPPGAVWRVENGAPTLSSPAQRGRETMRNMAEGACSLPLPSAGAPSVTAQDTPRHLPRFAGEERNLLASLDTVLEDSVRIHQRSDVPYGLFLSGGIDSTAIATLMARLNSRPVTAFTCGFDAPGARDERASAERIARALDLDWRETAFTEADFWRIAPEVASALDDPTTDYATLPTYKLAEAARGTLTVVLCGEGGDELFGGYGRYRRAMRPTWLGGRPAEPQIDAPFLKDGGADALADWRAVACAFADPAYSRLQNAQAADIATWLPNDLLLKLDRCLMAHGLEGRTPFLDREVAAFAFDLPDRMKIRGRYGKWLLRRWLERACPSAEPWARKKGFTVPVAAWIAPRAADLGPRVADCEGVAKVCNLDAVRAVFTDERLAKHRWPLLFYALWWTIHIGGASTAEAAAVVTGG